MGGAALQFLIYTFEHICAYLEFPRAWDSRALLKTHALFFEVRLEGLWRNGSLLFVTFCHPNCPNLIDSVRGREGTSHIPIFAGPMRLGRPPSRGTSTARKPSKQRLHIHGWERRNWRHLDTCGFTTVITAEVPRVKDEKGQTETVAVPWAEKCSAGSFARLKGV